MAEPILVRGNVADAVRELLARRDLQYWPLLASEQGPEIPYFGHVQIETRETRKGPDQFYMLARRFGWAVALVITNQNQVLLNIQPKPGLVSASLEMPAGGIGKDPKRTQDDIIRLTCEQTLRETGYGDGRACYLGFSIIETGKMYDPAVEEPYEPGVGRGLKAHCVLIKGARKVADPQPLATDKIQSFLVSIPDLLTLVRENVLVETSAVNCVALALLQGYITPN